MLNEKKTSKPPFHAQNALALGDWEAKKNKGME